MGYPTTETDPVLGRLAGIEEFWDQNYQGSPLESRFRREMRNLRSVYEKGDKRRTARLAHSWYEHFLGECDMSDLTSTIGDPWEMRKRFRSLEVEISGRKS